MYRFAEGTLDLFAQVGGSAEGLAFDVDGYLYVADGYLNRVTLFDPSGAVVYDPFALMHLAGPLNLAFGREADGTTNARLFAANFGYSMEPEYSEAIVEFNPSGIRAPGWPLGVELLVLTKDSLRSAVMGAPYADTLFVSGESSTATWSIVSGSLPPGIELDAATGILSGVPEDTGTFSFRARAEAGSLFGEKSYSIRVESPELTLADVADGLLGVEGALTLDEERYLDLAGNRNGEYDIGDFRAFLIATRAAGNAADLARVDLTERERTGGGASGRKERP